MAAFFFWTGLASLVVSFGDASGDFLLVSLDGSVDMTTESFFVAAADFLATAGFFVSDCFLEVEGVLVFFFLITDGVFLATEGVFWVADGVFWVADGSEATLASLSEKSLAASSSSPELSAA